MYLENSVDARRVQCPDQQNILDALISLKKATDRVVDNHYATAGTADLDSDNDDDHLVFIEKSFQKLFCDMIKSLELQNIKTIHKKIIKNLKGILSVLENIPEHSIDVASTILDLPIFYKSRWELLKILLPVLPPKVFESSNIEQELLASASDQDCAAHSSTLIISIIKANPNDLLNYPDVVKIVLSALCSSESATRSNAFRSWFSRIISFKSSQLTVDKILQSLMTYTKTGSLMEFKVDGLKNRLIKGISCTDFTWAPKFTADSSPKSIIVLNSLLRCCIAIVEKGSHVEVDIMCIERFIRLGVECYDSEVRLLAYELSQRMKHYSPQFEIAVTNDLNRSSEMRDEIVRIFGNDDTSEAPEIIRNLANSDKSQEELSKFYPISEANRLAFEPKLESVETVKESLDVLLEYQGSVEYPSVASVMKQLKSQNIDERSFVQKMTTILDFICSKIVEKQWPQESGVPLLFKLMSRCPLRAVVDHSGGIVKRLAKDDKEFQTGIFEHCIDLLSQKEENTRALTFELCLIPIITEDPQKLKMIWNMCKNMDDVKQRKMFEMLANVISSSSITVDFDILKDMLICSAHLNPKVVSFASTQLFASCTAKMLDTHHEVDRAILFVVADKKPQIFELITQILNTPPGAFSKRSFHLVLHLFSRLSVGNIEFYDNEQKRCIARMTRFVVYLLMKYQKKDQFMMSACVDAICSIYPWNWVKKIGEEGIYSEIVKESDFGVKEEILNIIATNLDHYHYWYIYKNAFDADPHIYLKSVADLPSFQILADIHVQKLTDESMEKLSTFVERCRDKKLNYHERNAFAFLLSYQSWMWSELSNGDFKRRYRQALVSAFQLSVGRIIENDDDGDTIISWITQGVYYLNMGLENDKKIEFKHTDATVTLRSGSL